MRQQPLFRSNAATDTSTHTDRATYLHILAGGRVAAGQRECEMHMLCIHSHSGCELVYKGGAESLLATVGNSVAASTVSNNGGTWPA